MVKRDPKQAERERLIFEAFLEAHPSFVKTLRESPVQPDAEFPDVIAVDVERRKVEWELGEWLEPAQTAVAKKAEASRDAIEAAIGDPGENRTQHVLWCMISLKKPIIPFQGEDAVRFRDEALALVRQVDAQWPENPPWHDPRGYRCTAFDVYPTLEKYLDAVQFEPRVVGEQERRRPSAIPWIVVEGEGGAYDPEIAVGALIERLKAKATHYGDPGGADVRLIVFYDEAILYNTPFRGLTYAWVVFPDHLGIRLLWLGPPSRVAPGNRRDMKRACMLRPSPMKRGVDRPAIGMPYDARHGKCPGMLDAAFVALKLA